MIQIHIEPGTVALSTAFADAEPIAWLPGPLFGGEMQA